LLVTIRNLTVADFPAVVALQRCCFPAPFPKDSLWAAEHLASHLQFPEGQWVATADDQVVASATTMLVSKAIWEAHLPWEQVTGGLHLSGHDPVGEILYGIDISVHPDFRGQGIARRLYEARFNLVRERNLAGYGTVCRLPGFSTWAEVNRGTVEEYAERVAIGYLRDRTMTPLLRLGLSFVGVIMDYMPDEESGNAGAILEAMA